MPDAARNFIHVTHKIDPQTKRASLDADIDFPLTDTATLMDIGPVAVQLSGARFTAHVHCDAAVGQQITQTSSGQISGNWVLLIGGVPLVTFVKTALTSTLPATSRSLSIRPMCSWPRCSNSSPTSSIASILETADSRCMLRRSRFSYSAFSTCRYRTCREAHSAFRTSNWARYSRSA